MHPILFHLGKLAIPAYGVLNVAALLLGLSVFARLAERDRVFPFRKAMDFGFMVVMGGEVGARLTYLLVEFPKIVSGSITLRQVLLGGRVVLGGVAVAFLVGMYLSRRDGVALSGASDAGFTGAALGMGIGRLGCLLAGCCYGKPTDLWWGITFTSPEAARWIGTPMNVPLHPTQVIQAIEGFALFALLYWRHGRRRFAGESAAIFLLVAGASRFLVEFLRGDSRGSALGISTSQWIGLAAILAGVTLMTLFGSRRRGDLFGVTPISAMSSTPARIIEFKRERRR